MSRGETIAGWLRPLWPRFAIGELFLLTFAAAVGVWQYRAWPERWSLVAASMVAAWFGGAWVVEGIGLLRRSHRSPGLFTAQRGGFWIAVFWRFVLAATVAACIVLTSGIDATREFWLAEDEGLLGVDRGLPLLLVNLCLVLALLTGEPPRGRQSADPVRTVVWLTGGAFCALVVAASSCALLVLVHMAIMNIERAEPSALLPPGLAWDVAAREREFGRWALLAAATAAANVWLTWLLARQWGRGRVRVAAILMLLGTGLAAAAAHVAWLVNEGAYRLSPAWVEGIRSKSSQQYLAAGAVALLAATWVAMRLAVPSRDRPRGAPVCVPPGFSLFGWAPMLAVAIGWWLCGAGRLVHELGADAASYFVFDPRGMVGAALVLLAVRHALHAWRWPAEAWASAPPPVRPLQFACVWLAATATILTAAPIALATVFSLLLWLYAVPK